MPLDPSALFSLCSSPHSFHSPGLLAVPSVLQARSYLRAFALAVPSMWTSFQQGATRLLPPPWGVSFWETASLATLSNCNPFSMAQPAFQLYI